MRTRYTQFTMINRLPKQSSLLCADYADKGYLWAVLDNSTDDIAIARPEYEEKYEFMRRT